MIPFKVGDEWVFVTCNSRVMIVGVDKEMIHYTYVHTSGVVTNAVNLQLPKKYFNILVGNYDTMDGLDGVDI